MVKTIIKEICMMLLICLAIALIFGIVFYDYIPVSKVIPNKVAYTVPEGVQEELNEDVSVQEIKPQEITYSVTESDLVQYKATTVYQPGNPNPFQAYSTGNTNSTIINGTTNNGSTTGGGNSGGQNGIQYYYPTNTTTK